MHAVQKDGAMVQPGDQPVEPFLLNPRNRDFVEGKARYPAEYWAAIRSSIVAGLVLVVIVPITAILIYTANYLAAKGLLIAWLIAIPCVLFILLPLYRIVRDMRTRRLSGQGQIVKGQLSYAEDEGSLTRGRSDYWLKATYRFTSPSGQELTGHNSVKRNDLRHGRIFYSYDPLPKPGTPVTILYVDEQHFWML